MLPHTQINQMPLAFHLIMAYMAALLVLVLISIGGSDGLWPIIIGLGLVFALSWLFSKLFIEITPKGVTWYFRWKLFGGSIPIAEIREADIVYFGWHIGYGHRWTKRGTLYRAWGLDVVQIHRQNGKPVFLGAADPAAMVRAIEAMQAEWLGEQD